MPKVQRQLATLCWAAPSAEGRVVFNAEAQISRASFTPDSSGLPEPRSKSLSECCEDPKGFVM